MRLALGMVVDKEKEPFFERIYSIIRPSFDGEIINSSPLKYSDGNWGLERTKVIQQAEKERYDWMIVIDGDEAMFPKDIELVKNYIQNNNFIFYSLPRIEFVNDIKLSHYYPDIFPDRQGRVFKLNEGFKFRGRLHEMIFRNNDPKSAMEYKEYGHMINEAPIYHYGRCKSKEYLFWKYESYAAMQNKKIDIKKAVYDKKKNYKFWKTEIPYLKKHPLK